MTESFYLICHEASRSPWICLTALRGGAAQGECEAAPSPSEPVLVLGGLLSHPRYYAPLGRTLTQNGYVVHFDDVFNARAFKEHVARLSERLAVLADACGMPLHLVGHSLGGLQAMALLAARPEAVRSVVAVASPIAGGTPWRPLQRFAERVLRVRARDTRLLRRWLAPYRDRVTTIAAPEDAIAPPASCAIPGAHNVVLADVPEQDRPLASHGGVIFMGATASAILEALRRAAPPTGLPIAV